MKKTDISNCCNAIAVLKVLKTKFGVPRAFFVCQNCKKDCQIK